LGDAGRALDDLKRAVELSPSDGKNHLYLAGLFSSHQRPETAREHLLKAIELHPLLDDAYAQLGDLALERNNLPAAEQADAGIPLHHGQADEALLKKLIEDHHRWTGSLRAREILDDWATAVTRFVKVFPHEYRRALTEMSAQQGAQAAIAKASGETKSTKAKA